MAYSITFSGFSIEVSQPIYKTGLDGFSIEVSQPKYKTGFDGFSIEIKQFQYFYNFITEEIIQIDNSFIDFYYSINIDPNNEMYDDIIAVLGSSTSYSYQFFINLETARTIELQKDSEGGIEQIAYPTLANPEWIICCF